MSNITRQRVGELQRGVFKILLDHPEGLPAKEIISRMPQVVPPTDFEKSDYPKHPGIQRYGKMIRFATIGPVKAGWLIKEKGRWYLTEEGKKAYIKFEDPEGFRRESSRLYYQWLDKQPREGTEGADEFHEEIGTSERIADASSTLEEAEETACRDFCFHRRIHKRRARGSTDQRESTWMVCDSKVDADRLGETRRSVDRAL